MEFIENQSATATSTSDSRETSSQYDSLSFGGTSSLRVREPTNDPSPNPNMNDQEYAEENDRSPVQQSSERQVGEPDTEGMAMNQSSSQVDDEEVPSVSHEVVIDECNPVQMNSDNSASTAFRGATPSVTTDTASSDGRHMNMYEYCCRFLGNCNQLVEQLKPVLVEIGTPTEDAEPLLLPPQIPFPPGFRSTFQKGLETMADICKAAADILNESHQMETGYPAGEQTNEIPEDRIEAPAESNILPLNAQLQISTTPKLASETAPQVVPPAVSILTPSQLLRRAQRIVNKLNLAVLSIAEQPQKFWKTRYIHCLQEGYCTAIQGESGRQRRYILIKWSQLTGCTADNLFVRVQLQSHDGRSHSTKVLVPPDTGVRSSEICRKKRKRDNVRPTLDDLIISDTYGFDKHTRSILCPVIPDEYKDCEKNLQTIMFNLYKTSEEITGTDETDAESSEDEEETAAIKHQLNKFCKLSIVLCRRTIGNDLEDVSNTVVTDLIEESKGTEPLAIKESDVTPQELCRCGKEVITVLLNTNSEKQGFVVRLDDKVLEASKIRGVTNKRISFRSSRSDVPLPHSLHLTVSKQSISKTINQNHDPYKRLDEDKLLDMFLPYVDCSDDRHVHKST